MRPFRSLSSGTLWWAMIRYLASSQRAYHWDLGGSYKPITNQLANLMAPKYSMPWKINMFNR